MNKMIWLTVAALAASSMIWAEDVKDRLPRWKLPSDHSG